MVENENKEEIKSTKNASNPNIKYVQVNDRTVKVKKLGLISYNLMMNSLQELVTYALKTYQSAIDPSDFIIGDNTTKEDFEKRRKKFSEMLNGMLTDNIFNLIKFLDVTIPDLGYDYICENIGLNDALDLVSAVVEVNKFDEAGEKLKNLIRDLLIGKQTNPKEIPSK